MRSLYSVVVLFSLMCVQTWAEEKRSVFPRLFVSDDLEAYCVVEINLVWGHSNKLQIEADFRKILDFISYRFNAASLAYIADTDIVGSSSFALFYDSDCGKIRKEASTLLADIKEEFSSGGLELTMTEHSESPLVVDKSTALSLQDFAQKNKGALTDCFISIRSTAGETDFIRITNALGAVVIKYRFPVLDIAVENNGTMIFALFDQCEDKNLIIERAMAWSDMAEEFSQPGRFVLEDVSADRYYVLRP